jgi:hypothetical protein
MTRPQPSSQGEKGTRFSRSSSLHTSIFNCHKVPFKEERKGDNNDDTMDIDNEAEQYLATLESLPHFPAELKPFPAKFRTLYSAK